MFYDYLNKDKREQESISTELSKQDDNRMIDFKDINKEVKFATVIANDSKFSKKASNARSPSILKNNSKLLNPSSIIMSKSVYITLFRGIKIDHVLRFQVVRNEIRRRP